MAKTRIRKFGRLDETEAFLQGGITGGTFTGTLFDLDGKTLIFSSPASATVTFAASPATPQSGMTIKEIVDQIIAGTTNISVRPLRTSGGYRLLMVHEVATPSEITLTNGTANTQLGFTDNQTGTVYAPPSGTAPRWNSISGGTLSENTYVVVTEE